MKNTKGNYRNGTVLKLLKPLSDLYDFEVLASNISCITNAVVTEDGRLEKSIIGGFIFNRLEGLSFKVRENSQIINKTIYLAVSLNRSGKKEVLGMWLGKTEKLLSKI